MNLAEKMACRERALDRLRVATQAVHERLELRLDAIDQLSDPLRRAPLLRRYAAFYMPADDALAAKLACLPELGFEAESRGALLARYAEPPLPAFPRPASLSEALGLLYVLEGSTLGGRLILRELARRGVELADLAFLDPYGAETGARWRSFLAVLERETGFGDEHRIEEAERGAVRGFAHAEKILCGDAP